jgi:hypothetical protein
MAFARDVYTASASQTDFTITFAYIDSAHVEVYKDGVLQTSGAGNDYTIVSSTIVRFNSGLAGGETVVLQRATSQTVRLVDYATASTLTEEDLDNDSLQAFYMSQESIDIAEQAMGKTTAEEWDFENTASDNVPTPTAGDQVANKTYVDAVTVAAGNVPTPDDPGEDNYFLKGASGLWDWFNLFGTANTWSAANSFSSLFTPAATGGDKGADTVNASAYYANGEGPIGKVLQVVNAQDSALATGTTLLPLDDTIPQNTEGDEYMTLSITPKSSSSRLKIEVVAQLSHSTTTTFMSAALFRDSVAAALSVGSGSKAPGAGAVCSVLFTHDMASPGTSATTFKIRAGCGTAGTTTFNGTAGSRLFGGISASSIIITEYLT